MVALTEGASDEGKQIYKGLEIFSKTLRRKFNFDSLIIYFSTTVKLQSMLSHLPKCPKVWIGCSSSHSTMSPKVLLQWVLTEHLTQDKVNVLFQQIPCCLYEGMDWNDETA